MKRPFLFFILLIICYAAPAQYKIRFILKEQTAFHHDSIFITGTFSNWDSTANTNYLLKPYRDNEKSIVLNLNAGKLRYKFHRGSWLTVEKQYNSDEVPDRIINIRKDTVLTDSVVSWRDQMITDKYYALSQAPPDTTQLSILTGIAVNFAFDGEVYNTDSALYYAQKAIDLQQKIRSSGEYKLLNSDSYTVRLIYLQEITATLLHSLTNFPKALETRLENLQLAETVKDKFYVLTAMGNIINDYFSMQDYQHVLSYGRTMDSILATLNIHEARAEFWQWAIPSSMANAYYKLQMPDSALHYAKRMYASSMDSSQFFGYAFMTNLMLGDIYRTKRLDDSAFYYYRLAIPVFVRFNVLVPLATTYEGMARLFQRQHQVDSALYYALNSLSIFQNNFKIVRTWGENANTYIAEISPFIAELYKAKGLPDSAYKYLQLSVSLKDSIYNTDKLRQFQTLTFNETYRKQQLQQQIEQATQQYKTRIKIYSLLAVLLGVLILAFILFRNNKNKQQANIALQSEKDKVESTLSELKSTQDQLIQSEKMASLGELTAGIAHEIQNPLNFVNNFSEVNRELIGELVEEVNKGNTEEVKALANDIKDNEEKINHHGKRADAIVKGMLQHSRSSTNVKEPTDINKLTDEYLRLAYHGLRAKDNTFNATLKTDYDESIGEINIIPQDVGRVILNLITNAFYAVKEKQVSGTGYEPTVSVSTKKIGNRVAIYVSDNGNGIPQSIIDKIFQPFFTTKPTGQGTGLGLSLSYDIVKAHGGEIKVESKEGVGSTFIIQLSI